MTSIGNVTFSDQVSEDPTSLLWLPHVLLALGCLCFLAVNFWCYHRKHRQRYLRKAEAVQTRRRMRERRMLLHMVKARYVTELTDDAGDRRTVLPKSVPLRSSDVIFL